MVFGYWITLPTERRDTAANASLPRRSDLFAQRTNHNAPIGCLRTRSSKDKAKLGVRITA